MMEGEERQTPSPDRLANTADRFQAFILQGIAEAHEAGTEIDQGTARSIAHVLGRALGRDSALAEFARTGEGTYEILRDEYLQLYEAPSTPPMIKEWIDWFGTHLVGTQRDGSGRQFMNEHLPPQLDRVLVRTELNVAGAQYLMYAPATLTGPDYEGLSTGLERLGLPSKVELQAYLRLRDVNAAADNLAEAFEEHFVADFDTIESALYALTELTEWETDLAAFGRERGIQSALSVDHDVVESLTREIFDLVDLKGRIYAFQK